LPNRGTKRHWTGREGNIQLHDLTNRNVLPQHGSDSDLADVHRATLQQAARLGMDADIDNKFKPRFTTDFANILSGTGHGLICRLQTFVFLRQGLPAAF